MKFYTAAKMNTFKIYAWLLTEKSKLQKDKYSMAPFFFFSVWYHLYEGFKHRKNSMKHLMIYTYVVKV